MERQYVNWKQAIERFWSAPSPDWREAARLIAEIAAASEDDTLRHAASQALPYLRHAAASRADRATSEGARRRIGTLRDVLHTLTAPRFGKRGVVHRPSPDEHYRQMLGLPLDRRLAATEIHQAFKRAAKSLHPDAGGDGRAFVELAAARDALMQASARRHD
jgi:hypothetical protein